MNKDTIRAFAGAWLGVSAFALAWKAVNGTIEPISYVTEPLRSLVLAAMVTVVYKVLPKKPKRDGEGEPRS